MSKQVKKTVKNETESLSFDLSKYIPLKYQTILSFVIIVLIFLIYYSPMYFGGMTFQSGDILTTSSLKPYVHQEREGYTLWFPYIFCGMPAYALATEYRWFNLIYVGIHAIRTVFSAPFSSEYTMWSFYLIILAFTTFSLIKYLTKNTLLSLYSAITTSFSTGIILFLFIGHVTKLLSLAFFPLVLLLVLKFREEIKLRDFAILIIALQLSVQGWHVQIIFYMLFALMVYYLYFLIRSLVQKNMTDFKQFFKSGLVFVSALIIAIAIQSDSLTQIYEYNPYSTRGTESITDIQKGVNPRTNESDFYQYATNWSFSPGEVLTFIVPSYYGFGSSKYQGVLTNNQEVEVNTYFGQMPFVDVAMYMGVAVFFLGLLSFYLNRKNPFVQFLGILVLLSLLISFGRTFPVLYDLMFYHFPFFDKFRVPSMMLVLVQISFPILAALSINRIIELKKEGNLLINNLIKYITIAFSVVLVLSLILSSSISQWFLDRVSEYVSGIMTSQQQKAQMLNALKDYMANMFVNDLLIALSISTISFALILAYLKNKINTDILIVLLVVISFFDLARIGSRGATYTPEADMTAIFKQPYYISAIKSFKDNEPRRLINLKRDNSMGTVQHNSNFNAYFLEEDFSGYSSIKPRTYQDIIDVVGNVNVTLWRMLNVKYVVIDQNINFPGLTLAASDNKDFVFKNENVLPRFYFVNSVEKAKGIEILNKIKNNEFDPKQKAFVEEDLDLGMGDSLAVVKINKYTDEKIVLKTKSETKSFLFAGNTFLPGWKAVINGKDAKVYKANYGFMGVVVPKGENTVELVYAPESFFITKYLALILSSLTIVILFVGIFTNKKKSDD